MNNVGSKGSVFRGPMRRGYLSSDVSFDEGRSIVQLLVLDQVVDLLFQAAFVEQVSEAD